MCEYLFFCLKLSKMNKKEGDVALTKIVDVIKVYFLDK